MLDINDFKSVFIECCHDELMLRGAASMEIEERNVTKPQIGDLNGLLFISPGSRCAPTLYVEDFYPLYLEGQSVVSLSHDAVDIVMDSMDTAAMFSGGEEFDFSGSSGNLKVRLLNTARNRNYLNKVPHMDLDCGFTLIADLVAGEFRANISNELLAASGMTSEVLFERALSNSSVSDPAVLYDMTDAIDKEPGDRENLLERESFETSRERSNQYVLSNSNLYWGSAALFYPGVMDKIHKLLDDDYYVLPSSVHELIIMAAKGNDPAKLVDIIRSANRIAVNCDDILADDLYMCRHGKLERVSYGGAIAVGGPQVC